ncbi:uncharacterized protein LOC131212292 [Anopheles bellator]|uniref:uncharacterized protein LOC131212292 n=1 Tax=Anopheles bellator TaxID=139047 RepID=UPI00264947B2|nr:uncharacterized protein LOC131212292 [Anopheles bellator]
MSQANSFQPWKQTLPVGLPSNLGPAIFGAGGGAVGYGKVPQPPPTSATATAPPLQPSPSSSSSSSSSSVSLLPAAATSSHLLQPGAMHADGRREPAPIGGTGGAALAFSPSSLSMHNGAGNDFLAQMAVNKLKLGKLNTSYELTAAVAASAADEGLELDPGVAAMRAMLTVSGQSAPLGDKEREQQIQQMFEKTVSDNTKKQILEILDKISVLRPPERLLLYLRMPGGYPETDPLRQSQNPLGTRLEINHTINWVRSHLEHDPNVSIPKQEVYDDYVGYCARINIKPLSTADFGKVMKQVFPGIRPRRLGTRGHSRYCYAAMRKATKLPIPKLPDITDAGGASEKNGAENTNFGDEESWKVVKLWAEALLPGSFGSINELATFIAKNNLNTPTGGNSRQQLHKKILQRELKEKRKLSAVALKKRRKKRRKTLSTSICESGSSELRNGGQEEENNPQQPFGVTGVVQQTETVSTKQTPTVVQQQQQQQQQQQLAAKHRELLLQQHMIKREQQDCLDEDNNNTTSGVLATANSASGKMLILQRQQSTNLNCDNASNNSGAFESISKELVLSATNFTPSDAGVHGQQLLSPASHPSPSLQQLQPQQQQQQQMIHQRLLEAGGMRSPQDQHFLSNIYCKKVRQAQQLKAVQQQQQQQLQQNQQQPQPPLQLQQQLFFPNRPPGAKRQLPGNLGYASRQKRLKLLQARQQRSLESQNNSAPRYDEQGNLILIEAPQDQGRDEFIIPRERVISICNMDKNALDDYLNCEEENSQDQDQELLKYFPEEAGQQPPPMTGNQLPSGEVMEGRSSATSMDTDSASYGPMFDDSEQKLFQIRMILEKNQATQNNRMQMQQQLHQSMEAQLSAGASSSGAGTYEHSQSGMGLQPGSAAASLAMLSQRHNTHGTAAGGISTEQSPVGMVRSNEREPGKQKFVGTLDLKHCSSGLEGNYELGGGSGIGGPSMSLGGSSGQTLQSPTTRRRNCSFVPISQPAANKQQPPAMGTGGASNVNHTPNVSPFVSPRSTPIHRKVPKGAPNGHTLQDQSKFNHQLHQQQLHHQQLQGGSGYNHHPHHQHQLQHQQQQPQQYSSVRTLGGYIKNELPASAPPSPSMMQPFRFGSTLGGLNCAGGGGLPSQQPTAFQPICGPQMVGSGGGPGSMPMALESRSSSVPLLQNYESYCNSNYNSVSQTPVPSEYDDFTDTGILDMLNEQSAQLSAAIKIEESELTLPDLLDQQAQQEQEAGGEGGAATGGGMFNIISRSVPSTPLPLLGGFSGGGGSSAAGLASAETACLGGTETGSGFVSSRRSLFEYPKSVPSTPITVGDGGCHETSIFQYSPETSRDFLINGNSVDRSKASSAGASTFYGSVGADAGSATAGVGDGSLGMPSGSTGRDVNGNVANELAALQAGSGGGGGGGGGACSVHDATGGPSDEPPSAEMANLTDGIEGLSTDLDAVTDSMMDSDILQNL